MTLNKATDIVINSNTLTALQADVTQREVNVCSSPFNAIGNGVAVNTAAIQAAVDYCYSQGGGTVFFPRGTYLTDTVTMKDNVVIKGSGKRISILKRISNGGLDVIRSDNANNVSYQDIGFDGNEANQAVVASTSVTCIRHDFSTNINIDRCYFTKGGDRAIDIRASDNIYIGNSFFNETGLANPDGNPGNAISCDNSGATVCRYVLIEGNTLQKFGDTAIGVPQCKDVIVRNNFIYGMGYFGLTPLSTESAISVNGCVKAICIGNIVENIAAFGIAAISRNIASTLFVTTDVTIAENILIKCGSLLSGSAIRVEGYDASNIASQITISKNTMKECQGKLWLNTYCQNFSIEGNIFRDMLNDPSRALIASDAPLRVYNSRNGTIKNNIFLDTRGTVWSLNDLYMFNSFTEQIHIEGNVFKGAPNPFAIDSSVDQTKIFIGTNVGNGNTQTRGRVIISFYGVDIAASLTNQPLTKNAGGVQQYLMSLPGIVKSIGVYSSDARTAGTLTVAVTRNGTGTSATAVLDGTNTQTKSTVLNNGVTTFIAGDRLGVRVTTTSDWAPSTADITVEVVIEV